MVTHLALGKTMHDDDPIELPIDGELDLHTFQPRDIPDVVNDIDIAIEDKDLRVDTFRASGAGGQHVNKTDSAVRITHNPTGVVVSCQNERSQHKNKATAMRILKAKLFEIKVQEQADKIEDIKGERKKIDFGSQIRSYVMQPYRMVKDHRTSQESGNVDAVLDGNIDSFIKSYLLWNR